MSEVGFQFYVSLGPAGTPTEVSLSREEFLNLMMILGPHIGYESRIGRIVYYSHDGPLKDAMELINKIKGRNK